MKHGSFSIWNQIIIASLVQLTMMSSDSVTWRKSPKHSSIYAVHTIWLYCFYPDLPTQVSALTQRLSRLCKANVMTQSPSNLTKALILFISYVWNLCLKC